MDPFLEGYLWPDVHDRLLALPLAAEFVLPHLRRNGRLPSRPMLLRVAACVAPLSGFAALATVSSVLTGSPKAFLGVQSSWGRSYEGSGLVDSLLSVVGYAGPPVDLLGLAVGLGMLPLIWKRLPLSMALFGTGMVLLPLLTGSILSFGRFMSVSVPHFLALAVYLGCRPRLRVLTILGLLTFQVFLAKGLIGWYFVG